ncbi:type II toxin-antitoxin system RelE/ParE family toxin [Mannheimia pernigra]|uniref:Type II toxin-antitoxin system RelE/ParE family toxin n=1 Tax=Mannheimia pernigra TaxID=111844 RepID=A0A7D5IW85_9PAST|nr:type II toxin-antitoxin system RelE/ParE family toxin [Mannheimia pernigra]QLB40818.1 type II toxin-antitoxin system RelE/ParE family toxin [Mannheimia pernigra]
MFNLTEAHFRDEALYRFFQYGETSRTIPANLTNVLARKLDMINAAENLNDLRSPPANRLELLEPKQNNIYSIRVNKQYRLIFKFENNELSDLYLDPHNYDL